MHLQVAALASNISVQLGSFLLFCITLKTKTVGATFIPRQHHRKACNDSAGADLILCNSARRLCGESHGLCVLFCTQLLILRQEETQRCPLKWFWEGLWDLRKRWLSRFFTSWAWDKAAEAWEQLRLRLGSMLCACHISFRGSTAHGRCSVPQAGDRVGTVMRTGPRLRHFTVRSCFMCSCLEPLKQLLESSHNSFWDLLRVPLLDSDRAGSKVDEPAQYLCFSFMELSRTSVSLQRTFYDQWWFHLNGDGGSPHWT